MNYRIVPCDIYFYMRRQQICEIACRPEMADWADLRDAMDQASDGELPADRLDSLVDDLEAAVKALRSVLRLPY